MQTPSSPSKRSRVTFDSDVEIVSADDEAVPDPSVVKEQVRRAIERHRLGANETYERVRAYVDEKEAGVGEAGEEAE